MTKSEQPKNEFSYPRWMNNVAILILSSIPAGFLFLMLGLETLGLTVLTLSFLMIYLFGEYLKYYRRQQKKSLSE